MDALIQWQKFTEVGLLTWQVHSTLDVLCGLSHDNTVRFETVLYIVNKEKNILDLRFFKSSYKIRDKYKVEATFFVGLGKTIIFVID